MEEKDIVAALSHHDRMHGLIENHIWMIQLHERWKGVTTGSSCDDLQKIKEGMEEMKVSYIHLLSDRDHLFNLVGIYLDALKRKEEEDGQLSHGLEDTQNSLVCTQLALQDSKRHVDELCLKMSLVWEFS